MTKQAPSIAWEVHLYYGVMHNVLGVPRPWGRVGKLQESLGTQGTKLFVLRTRLCFIQGLSSVFNVLSHVGLVKQDRLWAII